MGPCGSWPQFGEEVALPLPPLWLSTLVPFHLARWVARCMEPLGRHNQNHPPIGLRKDRTYSGCGQYAETRSVRSIRAGTRQFRFGRRRPTSAPVPQVLVCSPVSIPASRDDGKLDGGTRRRTVALPCVQSPDRLVWHVRRSRGGSETRGTLPPQTQASSGSGLFAPVIFPPAGPTVF